MIITLLSFLSQGHEPAEILAFI